MADDEYFGGTPYLYDVIEGINYILERGFGEVRVIIRNGVIYRVLITDDALMEVKKPE